VVPTRTYGSSDIPCREFQQTVTVEGRTIIAYDAACRGADGKWKSRIYASLDGAVADATRFDHSGNYRHHYPDHYPHYRFGYGHGHHFGHFGHFGHHW